MANMDDRYFEYYGKLVEAFVRDVESLQHPDVDKMPYPHLPLFGSGYEQSALKLVIVGQDTKGWGDLKKYLADAKSDPGAALRSDLEEFRRHEFTKWGSHRHTFWGFAIMALAAIHGQPNWEVMKNGGLKEVLDSFAWAEANAVELFKGEWKGVPRDYWEKVQAAGKRFDGIHHLVEVLKPNVVIVLYKGLKEEDYFHGYDYEKVSRNGRFTHFRLPTAKLDVLHMPHPRSMGYNEKADFFCKAAKSLMDDLGFAKNFPEFVNGTQEAAQTVEFLTKNAPEISGEFDKYALVAWIATEHAKRQAFMSVPTLASIINAKGGRTNGGERFSGGRGTYRLVSGSYQRYDKQGKGKIAESIAEAFRRPNFDYAYPRGAS